MGEKKVVREWQEEGQGKTKEIEKEEQRVNGGKTGKGRKWRREEGSLVTECLPPARPLQSNTIPISQMWRSRLKEVK